MHINPSCLPSQKKQQSQQQYLKKCENINSKQPPKLDAHKIIQTIKFVIDMIMSIHNHNTHIYPIIHPLMAIYRYMQHIATNEYHKNKHHISVKRLFLYFTLNNFKSLQFLVSISIEFQIFTPICSTHICLCFVLA